MRVEFAKVEWKGRRACRWDALRGARTRIPGTFMGVGDDLPHDLAQYVVEAATGFEHGFWGLLANGATFASTGRKRTKPGRALIAEHRAELLASEPLAQLHLSTWMRVRTGLPGTEHDVTPVTDALDHALEQWRSLGPDTRLRYAWPSADGVIVDTDLLAPTGDRGDRRPRASASKNGVRDGDAYTGRNAARS